MAEQNGNGQQQNALAEIKRDTADVVAAKVHQLQRSGELVLPRNYAVVNALKSAWLTLLSVDGALTCTKDSIYNAMLDMVVQGLNPAKKQCYFIPYGKQLVCQRSYFGDEQVARNVRPDVDIYYQVIYEGDEFEQSIVRGKAGVAKHIQKFENVNPAKIKGAYCVIEDQDGRIVNSAVMTLAQIRQSWKMSKTYKEGGNSFHTNQPDQACLRTVIRRACKPVINSSSDAWLLQAVRREEMAAEAELADEAATYGNGELIGITDVVDGDGGELEQGADEPEAEAEEQAPAQGKQPQPQGRGRQQTLGVGAPGPGY